MCWSTKFGMVAEEGMKCRQETGIYGCNGNRRWKHDTVIISQFFRSPLLVKLIKDFIGICKVTLIQLLLSFYHKYNHVEFVVLGDYVELQTATKMHKIGTHCLKCILANPYCCNWWYKFQNYNRYDAEKLRINLILWKKGRTITQPLLKLRAAIQ